MVHTPGWQRMKVSRLDARSLQGIAKMQELDLLRKASRQVRHSWLRQASRSWQLMCNGGLRIAHKDDGS